MARNVKIDKSDWNKAKPDHIPLPTYWPMFLAAGIVVTAYGFIFSFWFVVLGVLLFIIALAGWIGDMRNEHH